jgi:hypothetical protein
MYAKAMPRLRLRALFATLLFLFSSEVLLSVNGQVPYGSITNRLTSVIYANNLFVAVGNNTVIRSYDGLTWWCGACDTYCCGTRAVYVNGTFVSPSGPSLSSTDGIDWRRMPRLGETDYTYTMAYGDGMYLASAQRDIPILQHFNELWSSTNLVDWTFFSPSPTSRISDIVFNDGYFYFYETGNIQKISRSKAGNSVRTIMVQEEHPNFEGRLKFFNGEWLCTLPTVYLSTNGIDWLRKPFAANAAISTPLGYFATSSAVSFSSDLETWETLYPGSFEDVAYAHGTVVAVGQSASKIWRRNFKPEISAYFEGVDLILQLFGEPNDAFLIESTTDLSHSQWSLLERFSNLTQKSSTVITNALFNEQMFFRLQKL